MVHNCINDGCADNDLWRCGGPEEYIADGVNGLLVDHDVQSLSKGMCRIAEDGALRSRMSVAATQSVREQYSEQAVKSIFWDAFEKTYGVTEGRK